MLKVVGHGSHLLCIHCGGRVLPVTDNLESRRFQLRVIHILEFLFLDFLQVFGIDSNSVVDLSAVGEIIRETAAHCFCQDVFSQLGICHAETVVSGDQSSYSRVPFQHCQSVTTVWGTSRYAPQVSKTEVQEQLAGPRPEGVLVVAAVTTMPEPLAVALGVAAFEAGDPAEAEVAGMPNPGAIVASDHGTQLVLVPSVL